MTQKRANLIEWRKGAIKFHLIYNHSTLYYLSQKGYYCGYCVFPQRPLIERFHNGIVDYIPIHGGITHTQENKDGTFTYGFDCAHAWDGNDTNLYDINWLKAECERMARAIEIAKKYEKKYLLARTDRKTKQAIQKYLDKESSK